MAGLSHLVVAAFFLVMAGLLVILGCTVVPQPSAWPLASLGIYCLTPLPFFLCGDHDEDAFGDSPMSGVFNTMGLFIGGALLVSGPALAVVLYHTGVISGPALTLTLLGGLCFLIMGMVIAYAGRSSDGEDDERTNLF